MESLSLGLSSSPLFSKNPNKSLNFTTPKSNLLFPNSNLTPNSLKPLSNFTPKTPNCNLTPNSIKTLSNFTPKSTNNIFKPNLQSLSFLLLGFQFPLSSFASESASSSVELDQSSGRIDLEAIVVAIDDFFNRYPFFVAGVVFVWLFVIPVSQEYLRKYKFVSAIDAFKKLKDDPNARLLDIREDKTVRVMGSPNLKMLGKNCVQVEFRDGVDDEGFVRKVKENFEDPANTTLCILDNFDGDSMKVAELLFKNGFKEAYAIRGGVRGDNGWLEIQETLLPPSVHIYPKTKVKKSNNNGTVDGQSEAKSEPTSIADSNQTNNGYVVNTSTSPNTSARPVVRSSSPYSMYPDMKPPSSPTPSKPQ